MDLWEGVPLREVIWLANPKENVRRVYYQSWHPPEAKGFQSSLALSQVLETAPGESPVILAYKRNGQPIPAAHGGPVRMVVPGSYGNKSLKWVQRAVLTNEFKANDSDAAEFNNDTENLLKTRARFINAPKEAAGHKRILEPLHCAAPGRSAGKVGAMTDHTYEPLRDSPERPAFSFHLRARADRGGSA
jgi:DMSO/TMAO reductase YedYZ molybdopterin-dependent catalytic subunit